VAWSKWVPGVTRFKTRLNEFNLEMDDVSDVEWYNDCLQLRNKFEDTQFQIENLCEANDIENESMQRENFEDNYYRVLAMASKIIKNHSKDTVK
jgi:hypothetical protein